MIQLPRTLLLVTLALVRFLSATDCFSASSSSVANTHNDVIIDLMRKTATAEAKRLFQYYSDADGTTTTTTTTDRKHPTVWLSSKDAAPYISEHIDTILFDCDGVLYRTQSPCPGASECIRNLMHRQHKRVLFVTNNAGVNRRELREKLSKILNIDSLTNDQMISSSYASAQYLRKRLLLHPQNVRNERKKPRVHVIGSSGLVEELLSAGFDVTGGPTLPNDEAGSMTRDDLETYDFSSNGNNNNNPHNLHNLHPIDALVVGHDTDLNFRKLCIADNLLLRNPNALFVATNRDSFDVVDGNPDDPTMRHILGNGATVVALEYSSKRKAINVGKPSRQLFDLIQQQQQQQQQTNNNDNQTDELGSDKTTSVFGHPSRCLFVGDRLDTDIKFGRDNGMKSLLVMTGVTDAQTLQDLGSGTDDEPLPDFILPYVGMLVDEEE